MVVFVCRTLRLFEEASYKLAVNIHASTTARKTSSPRWLCFRLALKVSGWRAAEAGVLNSDILTLFAVNLLIYECSRDFL